MAGKLNTPQPKKAATANKTSKSVAVPSCRSGYESVSIRPIDNGYIVSRSTDKGYSESYSATKPKIEIPKITKGK